MTRPGDAGASQERAGSPRSGGRVHAGWSSRGYLPHYDCPAAVQHLVFRLADSLPEAVLATLERAPAKDRLEATDAALDAGLGSRALADPRIAAIVESALLRFDADRYRLLAWCVMPTHVHVLAAQIEGWPLASIVHAWKSFTANRANDILGRKGRFWAPEYFDRMMRDEANVEATRAYIETNPVAAGLCLDPEHWPWSSARPQARASTVPERGLPARTLFLDQRALAMPELNRGGLEARAPGPPRSARLRPLIAAQ